MNMVRGRSMPGVDPASPAAVAQYLNGAFPMQGHGGLYFTLWYGVYDRRSRSIAYCSAGHHPAYLVPPGRDEAIALRVPNVPLGVAPGARFTQESVAVPPGSSLYVFSDGVYEIELNGGGLWTLEAFAQALLAPPVPGVPETRRLKDAAHAVAKDPASFEDDFSMVVATFD